MPLGYYVLYYVIFVRLRNKSRAIISIFPLLQNHPLLLHALTIFESAMLSKLYYIDNFDT